MDRPGNAVATLESFSLWIPQKPTDESIELGFWDRPGVVRRPTREQLTSFYQAIAQDFRDGRPTFYCEIINDGSPVIPVADIDLGPIDDNEEALQQLVVITRLFRLLCLRLIPDAPELSVLTCMSWPPLEYLLDSENERVHVKVKERLMFGRQCLDDQLLTRREKDYLAHKFSSPDTCPDDEDADKDKPDDGDSTLTGQSRIGFTPPHVRGVQEKDNTQDRPDDDPAIALGVFQEFQERAADRKERSSFALPPLPVSTAPKKFKANLHLYVLGK
jgi:hypothetical protein